MNRVIKDPIAEAEKARKKKAKHAPPPKTLNLKMKRFANTNALGEARFLALGRSWEGGGWVYFWVYPDLLGSIRGSIRG